MKLTKRGSRYYLIKRVPHRFSEIESRKQIWIALRTDSLWEAKRRAIDAERDLENQWVAALSGDKTDIAHYDALSALAASRGFPYLPANEVAQLPLPNLLRRTALAKSTPLIGEAVLGSVERPSVRISGIVELYTDLVAIDIKDKSRDQKRIWLNTVKRCVSRFMSVVADKAVDELTRDDILSYRNHLMKRIEKEGHNPVSANREITALSGIFSKIHKLKGIGDPNLFQNLKFPNQHKRRPPFEETFIRSCIIPSLSAGNLNQEAVDILRVLINTGMRPSEVTCLSKDDICLKAEIPYIEPS